MKLEFVVALGILVALTAGCGAKTSQRNGVDSKALSSQEVEDLWKQVPADGVVQGGPFDKKKVLGVSRKDESVTFSVPLPPTSAIGFGTQDIPSLPGAKFSVREGGLGNKVMQLKVPLHHLKDGAIVHPQGVGFGGIVDPTKLPNGDPLPGVPGGELPKIAVKITTNDVDIYVYLSKKYFAVFIATPQINPFVNLVWPIKDLAGTKIYGYLATVAKKGSNPGGFYVSLIIPPALARLIDNVIK